MLIQWDAFRNMIQIQVDINRLISYAIGCHRLKVTIQKTVIMLLTFFFWNKIWNKCNQLSFLSLFNSKRQSLRW